MAVQNPGRKGAVLLLARCAVELNRFAPRLINRLCGRPRSAFSTVALLSLESTPSRLRLGIRIVGLVTELTDLPSPIYRGVFVLFSVRKFSSSPGSVRMSDGKSAYHLNMGG